MPRKLYQRQKDKKSNSVKVKNFKELKIMIRLMIKKRPNA